MVSGVATLAYFLRRKTPDIDDLKGKGKNKYQETFDCVRASKDVVIEKYLLSKPRVCERSKSLLVRWNLSQNVVLVSSIKFGHPTLDGDRDCESTILMNISKLIFYALESSKKISDKQAEVDLHEKLIKLQESSQNIQNKIKEDLRSFEGDIENKILSKNNETFKIRQKLALVERNYRN